MQEQPSHPAGRSRAHRRHNQQGRPAGTYVLGVVLTEAELCQFLIRSAHEYQAEMCDDYPCEVCDGFRTLWHELYHELSATHRLAVEEALEALDIRSPQPRTGGQ